MWYSDSRRSMDPAQWRACPRRSGHACRSPSSSVLHASRAVHESRRPILRAGAGQRRSAPQRELVWPFPALTGFVAVVETRSSVSRGMSRIRFRRPRSYLSRIFSSGIVCPPFSTLARTRAMGSSTLLSPAYQTRTSSPAGNAELRSAAREVTSPGYLPRLGKNMVLQTRFGLPPHRVCILARSPSNPSLSLSTSAL